MARVSVFPVAVHEYLRELKDVEWDILGFHLGFSEREIRDIERDHQGTGRRRIVMLDKWWSKEENPSWDKIIAALEKMSENTLARILKEKYIISAATSSQTTNDVQQPTGREIKVDKEDEISIELKMLKRSHFKLKMSVYSALKTANPSSTKLKIFCHEYLRDREVTTVEELFDCLKEFCFLDYDLLETIVSAFLDEDKLVVSDLNGYIQQLTNFKKSTSLRKLMELIENAQKPMGEEACTVTLRLVGGWLPKTMEDLDKLLKEVFRDKMSVLANLRIFPGSVVLEYLAPQSQIDPLIELAKAKLVFMEQVGVCGLRIGFTIIIQKQEMMHFSFESSLIEAIQKNNFNLLTFLLDINTNPNATDDQGKTALMVARNSGHEKAVSILLSANASLEIPQQTEAHTTSSAAHAIASSRDTGLRQIFAEASQPQSVSIVILGKPGSGKTSIASDFVGIEESEAVRWNSSAKSASRMIIKLGRVSANVIDTHGMMDTRAGRHDEDIIQLVDNIVRNKLKGVVIFCIELCGNIDLSTLEALALLHKRIGSGFWLRMVIALTKADRYEERKWYRSKPVEKSSYQFLIDTFAEVVENRKRELKKCLTASADQVRPSCYFGMTEKQFDELKIPIVPTSQLNPVATERMMQVNCGYWFDHLLARCCQRESSGMLQLHRKRLSVLPVKEIEALSVDEHQSQERPSTLVDMSIAEFRRTKNSLLSKMGYTFGSRWLWSNYCHHVNWPRFEKIIDEQTENLGVLQNYF